MQAEAPPVSQKQRAELPRFARFVILSWEQASICQQYGPGSSRDQFSTEARRLCHGSHALTVDGALHAQGFVELVLCEPSLLYCSE